MVKVWCVPFSVLDDKRLLGQHNECGIIFNALTRIHQNIKSGYYHHPQTLRFLFKEGVLIDVHDKCVEEMRRRGFKHQSPLSNPLNFEKQEYVYSRPEMVEDLKLLVERWENKKQNRGLHTKVKK